MLKYFLFIIVFLNLFYIKEVDDISPINLNQNNFNLYKSEKVFIHNEDEWYLTIPKVNLNNIPIKDGIENDILENYIGHFPFSSFLEGNVCLAAHNNGYKNNYFKNINMLEVGDEIYYHYFNIEKIYIVKDKYIIDEKDFLSLEEDNNQKLTLITCIDNSPHERLCIQAISKE
ncbi:MAG: sortase [Clostridia bacterium]|nr:sortase [Clostridia bacterium]